MARLRKWDNDKRNLQFCTNCPEDKAKLETGAKKIGLVVWAISDIKNGFAAFC